MKKLLIGLLAMLVLAVAAVVVVPSFIDWNDYKDRIAAEVKKTTGRDISIGGELTFTVVPTPTLTAADLTFANLEGAREPDMLRLKQLNVRVALLPLLGREVQIERIDLIEPVILLEVLPDGRRNWDVGRGGTATGDGGAGTSVASSDDAEGFAGQIRLDSFRIVNGTLIYRDALAGREEQMDQLNAEIAAESLRGPASVKGSFTYQGLPLAIDLVAGIIRDEGATPINLALQLRDSGAQSRFSGTVSNHGGAVSLRGSIKAEGADLAAVLATLGEESELQLLKQPFNFSGDFEADEQHGKLTGGSVKIGETAFDVVAEVNFAETLTLQGKLSAGQVDLDALIAAAKPPKSEGQAAAVDAGQLGSIEISEDGFTLPQDAIANLEVGIEALIYRGQAIRQFHLTTALADGRAQIDQTMLLPGGSGLKISGELVAAAGKPRLDGQIDMTSDNLRSLTEWLGGSLDSIAPDRLRRMSFSGGYRYDGKELQVSNIDLRVDLSRLTGGLVAAFGERIGLGVGLALDKINLDAYLLPPRKVQLDDQQGGGPASQEDSEAGGSALLDSFDANVDFKIGSVIWRGTAIEAVALKGTIEKGVLTMRDFEIGDFAGSQLKAKGTVNDLMRAPLVDGSIEMRIPDVARLARFAEIPEQGLAELGPVNISGNIRANREQSAINTIISLLGGRFDLVGTLDLAAAPLTFDLDVAADHPALGQLLAVFPGAPALDPKLGGLKLKGHVSGTPLKLVFSKLDGTAGPVALNGGFSADLAGPTPQVSDVDLTLAIDHPSVATLAEFVPGAPKLDPALGGVKIKGGIKGNLRKLELRDMDGRVGPVALTGGLDADLGGDSPQVANVDLRLDVNHPDLAALAALLPGATDLGEGLGPVAISARVSGTSPARLSEISGALGPLSINGSASVDLAAAAAPVYSFDLGFEAKHPSLATLLTALNQSSPLNKDSGALDFRGRASGDKGKITLNALSGTIGPIEVNNGSLSIDMSTDRPSVKADLSTGLIPLTALLAPAAAGSSAGKSEKKKQSRDEERWSREPIDLSTLRDLDGSIRLAAAGIEQEDLLLENAVIEASLEAGVLDIKRLAGTLYGGAVQVSGQIDARQVPQIDLAYDAIQLDVAKLTGGTIGLAKVGGAIDLKGQMNSSGASEAELVASLGGEGTLAGKVQVLSRPEQAIGQALLGALGQQLQQIQGFADATNAVLGGFAGSPARLSGSYRAEAGTVTTDDLKLEGNKAIALTKGSANLPRWLIESTTDLYQEPDLSSAYLTLILTGPLDEPNTKIKGKPFQPQSKQQTEPQVQQPQAPLDQLQQLLSPKLGTQEVPAPEPAPQPAPDPEPELAPEPAVQEAAPQTETSVEPIPETAPEPPAESAQPEEKKKKKKLNQRPSPEEEIQDILKNLLSQ